MAWNEFPGNLSLLHLYYPHQASHLITAEPHARYSVRAKPRLLHSFLSLLYASISYTSVVLEVPPPSGLFNFLFIRYRSSYFWENIPEGGRGQRFLLWNISTFPLQLLFSTQGSHHGLKMGLNYGWRLCLTQCGRWIGNTGKGGSVATLGRGMHLEFLTWGTLERGISCFERCSWGWPGPSSLGLDVFCSLSLPAGLQVPACQLFPSDWKVKRYLLFSYQMFWPL